MVYDKEMMCPMIDKIIPVSECIENVDTVNGLIKETGLINQYGSSLKEDWKEICKHCKHYEE